MSGNVSFRVVVVVVCLLLSVPKHLQFSAEIRQRNNPRPAALFITESRVLFIILWKYIFMTFCTIHIPVNNQENETNVNIHHNVSLMGTFLDAYGCSSGNIQIHVQCIYNHIRPHTFVFLHL